jgi:hypothetical protein
MNRRNQLSNNQWVSRMLPNEPLSLPIGGKVCKAPLDANLLAGKRRILTDRERSSLWRIFMEIGRFWNNVLNDSDNLKSSWLEFIEAKTTSQPSYAAEYSNAVLVVDELITQYGEKEAFTRLFLRNGIPSGPPLTRLAHAKKYVVDEFIRVNIVAGGFRSFGGRNYNGYLGGSRYNELSVVRDYKPQKTDSKAAGTK